MRAKKLHVDATELVRVASKAGHSAGSGLLCERSRRDTRATVFAGASVGAQERPKQKNVVGVEIKKTKRLRTQSPKRHADVPRRVHVGRNGMRLKGHEGRVGERKRRRVRRL